MQRALQRTNLVVALVATAAACSEPVGTSEPEGSATAGEEYDTDSFEVDIDQSGAGSTPTVTLYLGPKVAQAGESDADADDAAAVGSVSVTPIVKTNPVTIEWATVGTSNWTNLDLDDVQAGVQAAENLGGDGWVYFKARSPANRKYRAKYVYNGKTAISNVTTFTWTNEPDSLIFSDQFSDATLEVFKSSGRWALRPDYNPCAKADWNAVAISNGTLKLKAVKNDEPVDKKCYKGKADNGHLEATKFTFTSGWAAARIKFHGVPGSHAAFWLNNNHTGKAGEAEIDVAEGFGSPGTIHKNVYSNAPPPDEEKPPPPDEEKFDCKWKKKNGTLAIDGATYDAGFHVYSVRWKAGDDNGNGGYYHFYIDDKKVKTLTGGAGIANKPEHLILSMLTSDSDYKNWNPDLTYKFEVDWVRVWNDNPLSPVSPRPDFEDPEPETEPTDPTDPEPETEPTDPTDSTAFTWLQYPANGSTSPDGTFKLGIGNHQLASWDCYLDTPARPVPCTNGNMNGQITIEGTATGVGSSGHVFHVIATTGLGNIYDIYSEGWWGQPPPVVTWTSGPYNGQHTMPAVFTTSIENQPLTTWRCWLDDPQWVVDCSNPFEFSASGYYSGHTMYIETTNYGGTTTTIATGEWGW